LKSLVVCFAAFATVLVEGDTSKFSGIRFNYFAEFPFRSSERYVRSSPTVTCVSLSPLLVPAVWTSDDPATVRSTVVQCVSPSLASWDSTSDTHSTDFLGFSMDFFGTDGHSMQQRTHTRAVKLVWNFWPCFLLLTDSSVSLSESALASPKLWTAGVSSSWLCGMISHLCSRLGRVTAMQLRYLASCNLAAGLTVRPSHRRHPYCHIMSCSIPLERFHITI
jgi:hypothetical protein